MPKTNQEISSIFEKMAVLCELNGENIFKVRAYQKAAFIISNLEKNLNDMNYNEILSIQGIGKNIASHIIEILEKGSFKEFDDLSSKYPGGLLEILNIRGLGAKRVKILYEKFGVDSVEKLLKLAKESKIREIDGFGEKLEKAIIDAIEKGVHLPQRFLYHIAKKTAIEIIDFIKKSGYKKIEYAGSIRRCCETVGDIDILCVGDNRVIDLFVKSPFVKEVLSQGEKKASVILNNGIQCDFRVFNDDEFGSALCYFTGSKQHNIKLREIALKSNLLLNEYGVFKNYGKGEKIAGRSEEDVYKKLGLSYIPPELREDRGEIEFALKGGRFDLVELKDIKGDVHCHTTYTDGYNEISEIMDYLSRKYNWSFIGDHSVPLSFVKGLDFKKYIETRSELLKLSKNYKKTYFDRSLEVEVLKDGNLSFKEEELEEISLVISAIHTHLKLNSNEQTNRVIKMITNPYSDVIAHLSGRIIFEREELDIDYDRIFEIASKNNVVFEVNGQPDRLDLKDINLRKVKSLGLKVILTSDAHSIEQFKFIEYALNNARRAWLCKEDVLNTLEFSEFKEFISENRRMKKEKKL